MSAEKSLDLAVEKAGIQKEDIVRIVTTGYGRAYIDSGDDSITEITCHAKGAHYLNPQRPHRHRYRRTGYQGNQYRRTRRCDQFPDE